MACYSGFGNLTDGEHPVWTGNFSGDGRSSILFYYKGDSNWWLGTVVNNQWQWSLVGNTAGFGQVGDGRPIWTGRFSTTDRDQVLFYYPGDNNWWLGTIVNNQFQWAHIGNTAGFGQVWDGRPIWIADFTGGGTSDILFYYPGDYNWWLGTIVNNQLQWAHAGNTAGFGQVWDGRPIWIGDFTGGGTSDIVFYFPGDTNWWLGTFANNQLQWSHLGNTSGFGQVLDGRPIWIGDFTGGGTSDVLFYFPGDRNWWLGTVVNNQLQWAHAGNTAGFGQVWDGRPLWIGRFNSDRDQVLFYFPGDSNWWLGTVLNNQLQWTLIGNTIGFGQVWDGRPFWIGDFTGGGNSDVMFYFPGDGNWWLGSVINNQLQWMFLGNTGRPCSQRTTIHFKSLLAINDNIRNFINTQFTAMEDLFSRGGLAVYMGTIEDLSGNTNLVNACLNFDAGPCRRNQPTADHNTLFANRNNAGADDVVVYIVQTIINGTAATNFIGCATFPAGNPGCVVVQSNSQWLLAHEVGHVLGLNHVCEFNIAGFTACAAGHSDNLMFPNVGWTNVPPNLSAAEFTTMFNGNLTINC